jgi:multidrug resistance protein MdtO
MTGANSSGERLRLWDAIREDLAPEPGRLQAALRLGLAAVLTVGFQMTLRYEILYPAMTTVLVLTEARGLGTLTRVVLALIAATVGCGCAVALTALFIQQPWFLLPIMFAYIVAVMYWMGSSRYRGAFFVAGYSFIVVVFTSFFSKEQAEHDATIVYRSIITGIGCGGLVMVVLWPDHPWTSLRTRLIGGLEQSRQVLRSIREASSAGGTLPPESTHDRSQTTLLMQLAQHTEIDLDLEPPESSALITLIAFESRAAAVSEWVSKAAHAASQTGILADADLLKRCEMQLECILSTLRSPPSEPTFRSGTNDLSPDVPATPSALDALRALDSTAARAQRAATVFGALPTERNFLVALFRGLEHCVPHLFRMPAWPLNPMQLKHATKCAASIMVCALFCISINWAHGIGCVETVMLVVQATFGGTLLIGGLRCIGVINGCLLSILLTIFLIPTIETIPGFLLIFGVLVTGVGWALHGSPRVAVPALQTMITVDYALLQFTEPSISLLPARNFSLAVGMGVLVTFIIYRLIWPVRATHEMRVAVAGIVRKTASLLRNASAAPVRQAQLDEARLAIADGMRSAMSFHANAQLEADVSPARGTTEMALITDSATVCNGIIGALEQRTVSSSGSRGETQLLGSTAASLDSIAAAIDGQPLDSEPARTPSLAADPSRAWTHQLVEETTRAEGLRALAANLDAQPEAPRVWLSLS